MADESVLYVLDREQSLICQVNARLSFSGFTVDGKTIYIVDGYVLFRYDLEILQSQFLARPKTALAGAEGAPQRAYNLLTDVRFSASPSEGDIETIYDLASAADKANAAKLATARRLRSWVHLIKDAQKERRKTQILLLAKKGEETYSELYDLLINRDLQLAGMIDDARWLLGVDTLYTDRSCQKLFKEIEETVRKIETEAVSLRFSPPVLRQSRDVDGRAVYVMSAAGLVLGLTTSLSDPLGARHDPPTALEMLMDEPSDRSATISYLTSAGMTLLKLEDATITKVRSTPTTITPAAWIELLALKRSQSPWSNASLSGLEFWVHNVSTPTSKNLLFVSNDERSESSALQLLSSLLAFPDVNGSNDFSSPAPNLQGGTLFEQTRNTSYPVVAPVHFHPEDGSLYVYALASSSFGPARLLEWVDDSSRAPSGWQRFVGADATARDKKRAEVKAGQIQSPRETHRSLVWHKTKLQAEVTTEDWHTKWREAATLVIPFNQNRSERDALRGKASNYHAQVLRDKGLEMANCFLLVCNQYKERSPDERDRADCQSISSGFGMSTDTLWAAFVNTRALTLAEASHNAGLPGVTQAIASATAAYTHSPIWNAWKQAGPQLLKQN